MEGICVYRFSDEESKYDIIIIARRNSTGETSICKHASKMVTGECSES